MRILPIYIPLILLLLVVVTLVAIVPPAQAETIIPGDYNVTGPETWSPAGSPYIIQGHLNIASTGHLTITAGVEVQIAQNHLFRVKQGGQLNIQGTASEPVKVTSETGHFTGFLFEQNTHAQLYHCEISQGGAAGASALSIYNSDIFINQCWIHDNGDGSLHVIYLFNAGISPTISNTTIENNVGQAIYQETVNMNPSYQNLTITGNGIDAVVIKGGYQSSDVALDGSELNGRPFIVVDGWIGVNGGATLTLAPGTELQYDHPDYGLSVNNGGTLTAIGTPTQPITITATSSSQTFRGVLLNAGSHAHLSHCDISRAGGSNLTPLQVYTSDAIIDHCTIHDSVVGSTNVIELSGDGLSPTISNTIIENNPGRAIYQLSVNMNPSYRNLTLDGNSIDGVVIKGGYQLRDVELEGHELNGSPFIVVDGWIGVTGGVTLTLSPGTELQYSDPGYGLAVRNGGTLIGMGTPTQPITITATSAAQHFRGVQFESGSQASLTHCNLHHSSDVESAALRVYSPDVTISHCRIHNNMRWALGLIGGSGSPVLDNLVLIDNGEGGLQIEANVTATMRHNTIARNGGDGIYVKNNSSANLVNTILAGNDVGIRVDTSGTAMLDHTLWDGNLIDVDGSVSETNRIVGLAAFDADGYHLTHDSDALEQGIQTDLADDIDGQVRPNPPSTAPDVGTDEMGESQQLWRKWIDDSLWYPGFSQVVETSDTVEIIDAIMADPDTAYTLDETWNPDHLTLSSYSVYPEGEGQFNGGSGTLSFVVDAGHSETITVTKQFQVQPCNWTQTNLDETLSGVEVIAPSREIVFEKYATDLWIEAVNDPLVYAGQIATSTLNYGNNGGYETDSSVQVILTGETTLFDSDPIPSEQTIDGEEITWLVGDLVNGETGQINIGVTIPDDALPSDIFEIPARIADHSGLVLDIITLTYTVIERPLHDVSVIGATPSGELPSNDPVGITVELANLGNQTESNVPLNCTITNTNQLNVYDQTINSNIVSPGISMILQLPAWTPETSGTFTLTCQSLLPNDEQPTNDIYSHQITVKSSGTVDVWMKDNDADTGEIPSDHPWWLSPDIWIRHQPDGGLLHENPIAFQENTIYIRLRNRGQQSASGRVDIYWNRSRIGWPCKMWTPNVGSIPFVELNPGEIRIVSLTWTPQEVGHHGLHTVIHAEGDPANQSTPCSPHWPRWNNNVSWRNVIAFRHQHPHNLATASLVEATVDVVNVYDRPKDVDLVIERNTFPTTATITIRLDEDLFDRWWASPGSWSEGIEVLTPTREIRVTGEISGTIGSLPLRAYEVSASNLLFDAPPAGGFEVNFYEYIDGVNLGGVTYGWYIPDTKPPELVSHWPADGAQEIDLGTPITVEFDEEIAPLTFSLIMTPSIGVSHYTYNQAGTVYTVTHTVLSPATNYEVRVMAADASANPMNEAVTWSFTTRSIWTLYMPVINKP